VTYLLTDLVLPGISGRELLNKVRRRHPHIRCIAMSGYAEGSPDRRVDLPPEVVFLPKPFTRDALLRALDAATDVAEPR
jgi:two-component SAPR family response regulator